MSGTYQKVILCALFLVPQAVFGAQKPTPVMVESEATRLQLTAAQLQIVQYKFLQAKTEFEKFQAESTAEFQKLSAELTARIEAAYMAAGVTKEDFRLDPTTGAFSPAPKKAEAK